MRLLRSEWRERKINHTVNAIAPIKNPAANAIVPLRVESKFSEDAMALVGATEFVAGAATTLETAGATFGGDKLVSGNGVRGVISVFVTAGSIFGGGVAGATGLVC